MYYGLLLVSGVAFSCSTEFIPEINERLKLVKFSTEFKLVLTTLMILDYGLCWLIEQALKYAFSDYRPKDIAIRRADQIRREKERKLREEREREEQEKEKELALLEEKDKEALVLTGKA